MRGRILSGRCISLIGCRLRTTTWASSPSTTVTFEKYIQDFAEKTAMLFDAVFPHVEGAPPTPVAKNAQAFYQWALENNYPPIGFYSAYPGLGVLDIRALLADRESQSTDPLTARDSAGHRVDTRPRGHSGVRSPRLRDADRAALLVDGRSPGTQRAGNSRGSSAATNPTSRRSRRPRTGMSGSRPDPETISPIPRVARPTIASTSVSRGPDSLRSRSNNACQQSRSSPSACSSKEPRSARSWSATPDRVRPRTGSAVSEAGTITSW